jgi:hypothetical protein
MYVGPEHARDPLRGLTDAQCLLIHDGDVVLCPIQIDGPDGVLTAIEEEIVWPDLGATRPHLAER